MTKRRHRGRGVLTLAFASVVLAATAAVPIAAAAGTTAPTGATVTVSPEPGSHSASAATTISFRGAARAALGDIDVVGDITGRHTGHWTDHSDNDGASFAPSQPFASDEHVVVHTHVAVEGGSGDGFSFTTAHTVRALPVSDPLADDMPVASGAARAAATTPVSTFRTRPDLTPPVLTTDLARGATSPGLIAISPRGSVQAGPMLIDNSGQIVWDQPVTAFNTVLDTEMVTYGGKPALSFWEGAGVQAGDPGQFVVVDDSYRTVATIRAGNGYQADIHDLLITPRNTAYLMAYGSVARNLTAFGGVANGTVIDLIVQEIDIATGAVRFEWHSLDHIPLSESLVAAPADAQHSWDYLHGNALEIDRDGNLLVSGRHASAVWKVNRSTGALMWTLGRGGDFTPVGFADADWFGYQHDIRRWPDGTLSVFDNGSNGLVDNRPYSRGLVLSVDEKNMTVSIVRIYRAPRDVRATSQGSFRFLPDGHAFIGWGAVGQMTEYDGAGTPTFDLKYPTGVQSYRALRVDWHGHPTSSPNTVVDRPTASTARVAVSWNGATDVAKWVVLAGFDAAHLSPVASAARTGFETTITASTTAPVIQVEALDAYGAVLWPLGAPATGYWLLTADGHVRAFGSATAAGNAAVAPGAHIVGIARSPRGGYWLARSDGGVTAAGAPALGSLSGLHLRSPIVGIVATPDGRGYYLVARDGGVFGFGSARFLGSMAATHLVAPIVGIAGAPDGRGYYLVASDGGVFSFGSARFAGSMAGTRLGAPVVGIATGGADHGYYLVGSDGGVFGFGRARYRGSMAGSHLRASVLGMAVTYDGGGYVLVARDGGVFAFGNAHFKGAVSAQEAIAPVVGIALS